MGCHQPAAVLTWTSKALVTASAIVDLICRFAEVVVLTRSASCMAVEFAYISRPMKRIVLFTVEVSYTWRASCSGVATKPSKSVTVYVIRYLHGQPAG